MAGRMEVKNDFVEQEVLQEKVLAALNNGVAHFAFTKTDGTLRIAVGTKNPELMPHPAMRFDGVKDMLDHFEDAEKFDQVGESHLDRIHDSAGNYHTKAAAAKPRKVNLASVSFYDLEAATWKSYNVHNLRYLLYTDIAGCLSAYVNAE